MNTRRLLYVGLGRIAQVHARQLDPHEVEIIGGVDPAEIDLVFRQRPVERFAELPTALDRCATVADTVVIASPTRLHAQHLVEVSEAMPFAAIWVEKPLAIDLEELELVNRIVAQHRGTIAGIFHAASAPEVAWARRYLPELRRQHGEVTGIEQSFADAYAGLEAEHRRHTLLDPWIDSGINALSILGSLSIPTVVAEQRWHSPLTVSARFVAEGVTGTLMCSWEVTQASKWTRLTFADGAVLRLEHQASAAALLVRNEVVSTRGWTGERLDLHYRQAFDELLSGSHPGVTLPKCLAWHQHLLAAQARRWRPWP